MLYWICFILVWLPITILFPTRFIKMQKLPKKQPLLIACNHMSNWDAILIHIKLGRKVYFLAKKELYKNKFSTAVLNFFGGIKVDRQNVSLGAIREVFAKLKNNKTVCFFPQGTRKSDPNLDAQSIKDGVAMFSLRTNTPVLPMIICKKPKIFRFNTIKTGKLIYPDQQDAKDKQAITNYSVKIIDAMNDLLKNDVKYAKK